MEQEQELALALELALAPLWVLAPAASLSWQQWEQRMGKWPRALRSAGRGSRHWAHPVGANACSGCTRCSSRGREGGRQDDREWTERVDGLVDRARGRKAMMGVVNSDSRVDLVGVLCTSKWTRVSLPSERKDVLSRWQTPDEHRAHRRVCGRGVHQHGDAHVEGAAASRSRRTRQRAIEVPLRPVAGVCDGIKVIIQCDAAAGCTRWNCAIKVS